MGLRASCWCRKGSDIGSQEGACVCWGGGQWTLVTLWAVGEWQVTETYEAGSAVRAKVPQDLKLPGG